MNDSPQLQTNDRQTDLEQTAGARLPARQLLFLAVILVGLLFFSVTSPKSVPSIWLIAGFVVLAGMLYAGLRLILLVSGLDKRLAVRYKRALLLCGTVLPVILLMMQSVGQLTIRDFLTLGGLFLIGAFYAVKTASPSSR